MTEIELLKSELRLNRGDPLYPLLNRKRTEGLAASMFEESVPETMLQPKMKGHIKRAARMIFLADVVGRQVETSGELSDGELIRVIRWLTGQHPSPNVVRSDGGEIYRKETRGQEIAAWCLENQLTILALATTFKPKRKEAT